MSSASEISIVHVPLPDAGADGAPSPTTFGAWSPIEVPQARRPTPTLLVALACVAGIGALILGVLAGVSTLSGPDEPAARATSVTETGEPVAAVAEKQALALLAKPSTERIVFRGSRGRLLLAVGSGGRAAILVRGLERASGPLYGAWIMGSTRPIRAARFDGSERAVFLSLPLRPGESVVVAQKRPAGINPATQLVALRG